MAEKPHVEFDDGSRGLYYSDLLKIKKLFLEGVGVDHDGIKVRQLLTDPRKVEVTASNGDTYLVQILQGHPLPEDQFETSDEGYMWLVGHKPEGIDWKNGS